MHIGLHSSWVDVHGDSVHAIVSPEPLVGTFHALTAPVEELHDVAQVDDVAVGLSVDSLFLLQRVEVDRTLPACEECTVADRNSYTAFVRSDDTDISAKLLGDVSVILLIADGVQNVLSGLVVDQLQLTSLLVEACNLSVDAVVHSIELVVVEGTLAVVDGASVQIFGQSGLVVLVSRVVCNVLVIQMVVSTISVTCSITCSDRVLLAVLSCDFDVLRNEVILISICDLRSIALECGSDRVIEVVDVATVDRLVNIVDDCAPAVVSTSCLVVPVVVDLLFQSDSCVGLTSQVGCNLHVDVLILSNLSTDYSLLQNIAEVACSFNRSSLCVVCQILNFLRRQSPCPSVVGGTQCICRVEEVTQLILSI